MTLLRSEASADPLSGPVAAYSFDENQGTTAHDSSGNGHDATVELAEWSGGRYGSALQFNGYYKECAKAPDAPDLQLPGEFTLEAWVKPTGNGESEPIVFKETKYTTGYSLYFGEFEGGHLEGIIGEPGYEFATAEDPAPMPEGVWTHVALTFDGEKMRLYRDGELVDTASANGAQPTTGPLSIGCSQEFHDGYHGKIDELRIYNRALSQAEVEEDRVTAIQSPPLKRPVAAYSFDENQGTTAHDSSGNGHDATVELAEWSGGRYGSALQFNGYYKECAKAPDAPDLQLPGEFTLEAWVKPTGNGESEPIVFKETKYTTGYSLYFGEFEGGHLEGIIGEPGYEFATAEDPAPMPEGVWTHVALTFDGEKMRLYRDGELVDTASANGAQPTTGPLSIGCSQEFHDGYHGKIDELRIYNRALSQAEVEADEEALSPEAVTEQALGVNGTEAVLTGTVAANGEDTEYKYEYGTTTAYGSTIHAEESVTGHEEADTEEAVVDLKPETTYHYRVVATSSLGTDIGPDRTFTTTSVGISGPPVDLTHLFGVQWGHPDTMDEKKGAEMARCAGASFLRIEMLNPALSQHEYDEIFVLAAKRHITVLPHLGSGVFESTRPGWTPAVEAIVRRYGRNGELWALHPELSEYAPKAWEVWNEPNYVANGYVNPETNKAEVKPEKFGELLHETAVAVRAVDPGADIIVGGLLSLAPSGNGVPVGEFISKMGHSADYTALGLHPYAFKAHGHKPENATDAEAVAETIQGNIKEARTALDSHSGANKPIWISEIGFPVQTPGVYDGEGDGSHLPVSETEQRYLLNDSFDRMVNRAGAGSEDFNIQHVIYYNLQDQALPKWDFHTGLRAEYDAKGIAHRRPAWGAFQEWAGAPGRCHGPKAKHKERDTRPTSLTETATFNANGFPTRYWIKWGSGPSSEQYGNFTTAQTLPSIEEADVDEQPEITGLQPQSTYHYSVVAENDAGEKEVTPDIQFTTPPRDSVSSHVDRVLHGQPGWAWVSGWAKEGEIEGPGPGLNGIYVNVNFVKNGQTIQTVHPEVHEGHYETGWVSGLGTGEWETRTVLPPQAGYVEAKSAYEFFTVHDGVQVVAKHSGKCMDISGASTENGVPVMHGECLDPKTAQNQVFTLVPDGNGFHFVARHSGKCIDINGLSTADGAQVIQHDCNGQLNQRFLETWWGTSNYATYSAAHSGKCLDVTGGSTGWVPFQQWTCNGAEWQRFQLKPVDSAPIPTNTYLTIDQALHGSPGWISVHGNLQAGTYSMANRVVHVEIDNANTAGWDTSGGNIAIPVGADGSYSYRDWRLEPGHWNIRASFAGDSQFAGSASGQQYFTIKRGYLLENRYSNLCLQLSENKNLNTQPFIQWPCSAVNGNGQVVSFYREAGMPEGWYQIRVNGTNRCLDVRSASTADGAVLQLYDCLGVNQLNQHWHREPLAYPNEGWYGLIARHSGKCASNDGTVKSGHGLYQQGCVWSGSQQWRLEGVIEP